MLIVIVAISIHEGSYKNAHLKVEARCKGSISFNALRPRCFYTSRKKEKRKIGPFTLDRYPRSNIKASHIS
jgi:hypothetical protein